MRHHLRRALALFAVAASGSFARVADADPSVPTGPAAEGVFGGANQGSADASGAFGYSVPLDLPRGRGLVQPRISLG